MHFSDCFPVKQMRLSVNRRKLAGQFNRDCILNKGSIQFCKGKR